MGEIERAGWITYRQVIGRGRVQYRPCLLDSIRGLDYQKVSIYARPSMS